MVILFLSFRLLLGILCPQNLKRQDVLSWIVLGVLKTLFHNLLVVRNKETMLASGVISLLEEMISNPSSQGPAAALYLNLSCLEEAKPIIGTSPAVSFLTQLLRADVETQCKLDALHTLYNLSGVQSNIPKLISAGISSGLQSLLADSGDQMWTEKCIAVLINLGSSSSAGDEMMSNLSLISALATISTVV
ncbi:U-box domain-containing protein 7-like isoform X1 [Pyrus x bretschneideri]|uniref:U-box domain-containing protein 7-like isoform X1 n=1 Tax=Pyrus x bretschneideri TaxID=225117 RepID=UPI002030C24C|nr:U-box domain-containing protein 7-like isoform X1 [Pyrus x bretschneideri]